MALPGALFLIVLFSFLLISQSAKGRHWRSYQCWADLQQPEDVQTSGRRLSEGKRIRTEMRAKRKIIIQKI